MFCSPRPDVFRRPLLKFTKLAGFVDPRTRDSSAGILDGELMEAGDSNPRMRMRRVITAIANSSERKREREREREGGTDYRRRGHQ